MRPYERDVDIALIFFSVFFSSKLIRSAGVVPDIVTGYQSGSSKLFVFVFFFDNKNYLYLREEKTIKKNDALPVGISIFSYIPFARFISLSTSTVSFIWMLEIYRNKGCRYHTLPIIHLWLLINLCLLSPW